MQCIAISWFVKKYTLISGQGSFKQVCPSFVSDDGYEVTKKYEFKINNDGTCDVISSSIKVPHAGNKRLFANAPPLTCPSVFCPPQFTEEKICDGHDLCKIPKSDTGRDQIQTTISTSKSVCPSVLL